MVIWEFEIFNKEYTPIYRNMIFKFNSNSNLWNKAILICWNPFFNQINRWHKEYAKYSNFTLHDSLHSLIIEWRRSQNQRSEKEINHFGGIKKKKRLWNINIWGTQITDLVFQLVINGWLKPLINMPVMLLQEFFCQLNCRNFTKFYNRRNFFNKIKCKIKNSSTILTSIIISHAK